MSIPALKKYIEESEVRLYERLDHDKRESMSAMEKLALDAEVYWLKNQLGFQDLPFESFIGKWDHPDGQYKNWAVVLQTLHLVPELERKNSTGIIVGAKMIAGSGQWLPFLMDMMLEMGFTGEVSIYDLGVKNEEATLDGLTLRSYEAYYEGKGTFTWCVDDIFLAMQPGQVVPRAKYSSFKAQKKEAGSVPFFFHSREGRLFMIDNKPVMPQWPWQQGRCPCNRCCFESLFPDRVQMSLRYFEGRCRPGAWSNVRRIVSVLSSGNAFKPDSASSLASALLVANAYGLASGAGCIQPYKGDLLLEDQKLKGPPPQRSEVTDNFFSIVQPDMDRQTWNFCHKAYVSDYVRDVASEIVYLPEGTYLEYEPTSHRMGDKRGFKKLTLPVEQEKNQEKTPMSRQRDPYGRIYFGQPCGPSQMWCWLEKKIVNVPHKCIFGKGPRRKVFKGFATNYRHPDRAKDLCTKCDRSINSYFHDCGGLSVFLSVQERKKSKDEIAALRKFYAKKLQQIRDDLTEEEVPSWTDEQEGLSRAGKKDLGIDPYYGELSEVLERKPVVPGD